MPNAPKSEHNLWVKISNHPIFQRYNFACGVYKDQYILIAGGRDKHQNGLRSAVMYNTLDQSFKKLPDLPELSFSGYCSGVIVQGYFYVLCYQDLYRICLSTTPAYSKWELVHLICRHDINSSTMVTDGNSLYFLYPKQRHMILHRYDPQLNNMTRLPAVQIENYNPTIEVVNNKIYIIEDCHQSIYHIATQVWTKNTALKVPLSTTTLSTTVANRWIIVMGGYCDRHLYVLDTKTQNQRNITNMKATPRRGNHFVFVGSQLVSIGGYDKRSHDSFHLMKGIAIKSIIPEWKYEGVKHFILLRALIDNYRANGDKIDVQSDTDKALHKVMRNCSLDTFRHVMTYLI